MALYFGLQALQAYVMFGWLPTILADAGVPDTAAALQVAIIAAVGVPISAVTPTLVGRYPAPRLLIIVLTACYLAGYLGVLWAPTTLTWLWSVLIGIGGGAFPVALTLIAMRARTPAGTITLSAFAQSAGYLVASIGPVLIGALHDWTGGWRVPLICLCGVLALHLLAGLAAAWPRYVEDELPATTGPPAG
jgi:CP family cyanate transporter-like MFS transporter